MVEDFKTAFATELEDAKQYMEKCRHWGSPSNFDYAHGYLTALRAVDKLVVIHLMTITTPHAATQQEAK